MLLTDCSSLFDEGPMFYYYASKPEEFHSQAPAVPLEELPCGLIADEL
jgi:hypothetical protein